MSQHDYDIANQAGAAFRSDINSALAAIVSQNSGATAPSTTFAYQWWADTTTGLLKIRNAANIAWVTVGTLSSANLGLLPLAGGTLTGRLNFAAGTDIASAATINLSTATGNLVRITGTTTTTAVTIDNGQRVICYAVAAWPLTYHATNMPLPGSVNYTCAAGDILIFSRDGSGNLHIEIIKRDGTAMVGPPGFFFKDDPTTVTFTKTGNGTAQIKAGTKIEVDGTTVTFSSATSITMPSLTAGTDYAIYACTDGTVRADSSFSAPSGYTTSNSRKIGGFHYAPGGNAAAQAGGDTTPAINAYSLWDLKFRPACSDPRGMTLVADSFWADIYLLGVDHLTNGTSKYNVTIADGITPPKIPTKFGGTGAAAYSTLNWWEAAEVMESWGKRLPSYDEFAALAYGTTEATASGSDPVSTILRAAFTSKWGVMLATGNLWIWGAEFGGGAAGASWTANTGGRGSTYQMANAAAFGGGAGSTSEAGSRCSSWTNSPTISDAYFGVRGIASHYMAD